MINLVQMSQTEYEPFMVISCKDQKEGQVLSGEWQAQEADEEMNKLMEQFLPQGLLTPITISLLLKPRTARQRLEVYGIPSLTKVAKKWCL